MQAQELEYRKRTVEDEILTEMESLPREKKEHIISVFNSYRGSIEVADIFKKELGIEGDKQLNHTQAQQVILILALVCVLITALVVAVSLAM